MGGTEDVTGLLRAVNAGERGAMDALMPLVYAELRATAGKLMGRERLDHTLQATALVNEAYMKLVDQRRTRWRDRLHFYAIAARIMRRVLADHARGVRRRKRGGGWKKVSLDAIKDRVSGGERELVDLADIDDALARLESIDTKRAKVVEMRFFGGMSEQQIADYLNVNVRTVERYWKSARHWLMCELDGGFG